MSKRLTHGVGVNDMEEPTHYKLFPEERHPSGGFKYIRNPFYSKWESMLSRCYSRKYQENFPTYKGCSVCREWLSLSNFKSWMEGQDWEGMELDKDLLVEGNKIYSPETCVFIHEKVNYFIYSKGKGGCLVGSKPKNNGYQSDCSNPFTSVGEGRYIGVYNTEIEAHFAWKERKYKYACELANSEYVTDPRVATILRERYKNYTVVEAHLS